MRTALLRFKIGMQTCKPGAITILLSLIIQLSQLLLSAGDIWTEFNLPALLLGSQLKSTPEVRSWSSTNPWCSATESDGWYSDDDTSWCIIDSQNWVGSDFVKPNCTTDPTNAYCSDPTNLDAESTRIANLYGDDVVSSAVPSMNRLR